MAGNMAAAAKNIKYLGRQPPATDLIGKTLEAIGGILRPVAVAIDEIGISLMGKTANKEKLLPNLAWLPHPAQPGVAPSGAAHTVQLPWAAASSVSLVTPAKKAGVFVAPNAHVIGSVRLGYRSSVWYGAVLRGDINNIVVGDYTNIQDNCILHVARDSIDSKPQPTVVGNNVTVGHAALLHACTIGDNCLVGMGATLLDGVKLESGSMVAAGAVVPPGTVVPSGEIWAGSPARKLRALTAEESAFIAASATNYATLAAEHIAETSKSFEELVLDKQIAEERSIREGTDIDVHQGIYRDPETQAVISVH